MTGLATIAALCVLAPPVGSVEELPKLLGEEFDLLEALDELDEDRKRQERLLAANQAKRLEVIVRRDKAAEKHRRAKATLQRERQRIRRRITVYVELKRTKDWQILASSDDYAGYLRKRRLLKQLVKDDEERIRNYHKVVERYREARVGHEKELSDLSSLESKISDARTRLERDKAIKLALLQSVRADKQFYVKAERDLDKAADALQERISNFEEWKGKRLWFRDLKGQYLNPVPGGKVITKFGKKTHPKFGTVTLQRGIDIVPGRKGVRTVRNIYWGRVVYAGWLKGYGQTVIVDHTKGDYTLYAHLAKVIVKKGDMLKSRQAIGKLGRSGSLEGEHLYFELRMGGKPVDPLKWLR